MNEKRKRRRTGCITCRSRRVKCDEGKPTCARCDAANIECLGYQQKRQISTLRDQRNSTVQAAPVDIPLTPLVQPTTIIPAPKIRSDGLPLIGLPNNPHPSQRPHSRARDVLAYHQFLFQTLPLLFRQTICGFGRIACVKRPGRLSMFMISSWALGGIHRATLLMSTSLENDSDRGLDVKVIAAQGYTDALQRLSEQLREAEQSMDILVGCLLLLAYFEVSG